MQPRTLIQSQNREVDSSLCISGRPSSLASRLPKRSLRKVFAVPLSGEQHKSVLSSPISSDGYFPLKDDELRVDVAAIPSPDESCRHHLFVEDGKCLRKLDLPSTACVIATQRFEAHRGDSLQFVYVVLLKSGVRFEVDRPSVRAVLVNRTSESAISLLDYSIENYNSEQQLRTGSHFRGSQSYLFPAAGNYELRFITFIDSSFPSCEAQLLVKSVRVVNRLGHEVTKLASLSCVGRVDQSMIQE